MDERRSGHKSRIVSASCLERLSAIIDANDFEKTSGRKPGQEDVHAYLRKGTPGDWCNHSCRRLKTLFKANYGESLIRLGYEFNGDW
jgi:hypothetical protein